MIEKDFYNAKDILKITGLKSPKSAYDIITELQDEFKKEYPGSITCKKIIPIHFADRKLLGKEAKQ